MTTQLQIAAALAVLILACTAADARPYHAPQSGGLACDNDGKCRPGAEPNRKAAGAPDRPGRYRVASEGYLAHAAQIVSHPSGCPRRAFCGCGAALEVFGRHVRDLWLARNWLRFPPAVAGAGMVAARRGHVMVIRMAHGDGTATVYDANSGQHLTRIHRRSLAGYRIVNPHGGSRYAKAG